MVEYEMSLLIRYTENSPRNQEESAAHHEHLYPQPPRRNQITTARSTHEGGRQSVPMATAKSDTNSPADRRDTRRQVQLYEDKVSYTHTRTPTKTTKKTKKSGGKEKKHTPQPLPLNLIQHIIHQNLHRIPVNIMRKHHIPTSTQLSAKFLKRAPDLSGMVILIVLGIDTGADDMVPEIPHGGEHEVVEHQERRAHVCWEYADHAQERFFQLGHLGHDGGVVQCLEVGVVPSRDIISACVKGK